MGENEERSLCLDLTICLLLLSFSPFIQLQLSFHKYLLSLCYACRNMLDMWAISAFKELKIQRGGHDSQTRKG